MTPAFYYFAIGYGSLMVPCCLKFTGREEFERRCHTRIMGGAVGKSIHRPKDAKEADYLIRQSKACGKYMLYNISQWINRKGS